MGFARVEIDGAEISLAKNSLLVELRIEERSTAEFAVVDLLGTASYQKGQPVEVYDTDNNLIFGGVIDSPETGLIAPSGELLHPMRCADWHYLADKRLVAESYEDKTCGFIVDDIYDKYLADEGVTIGNIELGATLIEAIFNYVNVATAFDALAEKAAKIWFIDENKALYFQDRDVTAAPWTATGADFKKRSTRLSGSNPLYRNRQYIRGGRGTTDLQTETFTGNGVIVAFTVGFPIVKVPTVTVNAVGQTVGIKGLDDTKDCYWNKGDATITFDAGSIPGAVAVVIAYYGQFDILTLVENVGQIASQLAIEGVGTGYNDDISDEPTLNDTDASFDSGLAKLARFGVLRSSLYFETVRTGLKPGQLLTVDFSPFNLSGAEMLVEAVKIWFVGNQVTYGVTVIQGAELGSWARFFKALANIKGELIDHLNVGAEQVLVILMASDETWEWDEDVDVTVNACTLVNGTVCGGTGPVVC